MILAAARTSGYQMLKLRVLDVVPLSKDAVHVYIGMACLLVSLLVLRVPLRSYRAVILGVVAALTMEALDLRDDLATVGHFRSAASLEDVVNTNLIPLATVTVARLGWVRK